MNDAVRRRKAADLGCLALILLGATILLRPLLDSGFVTDDYHALHVSTVSLVPEDGFSLSNLREMGRSFVVQASPHVQLYRPAVMVSFVLDFLFFGANPLAFQITNLCLHLLAGCMLFWLLRELFPKAGSLLVTCATGVFLMSPLQLEVVAWSAARSESISLIFGAAALALKIRRPDRILAPILLAAASLTAKESALVFLPAIFLIDLMETGLGRDNRRRLLARAVPPALVCLLYMGVRLLVFDRIFGRYNRIGAGEYFDAGAWGGHFVESLAVLFSPVSRIAFESLIERTLLMALPLSAMATLVTQILLNTRRTQLKPLLLALVVFGVPLALSVMVNPATHQLVGTRAFYTPMGAVAILLVLASGTVSNILARWLPITFLLLASVICSRPSQDVHLETHEQIQETLETLWEPAEALAATGVERLVILNYREVAYFDGGFTMAAALAPAMRTPFLSRNFQVTRVACNPELVEGTVSLDKAFPDSSRDTAIFVMNKDDTGNRLCSLVSSGFRSAPGGGSFELLSPPRGQRFEIILGQDNPPKPFEFRFRTSGFEAAKFGLQIYMCDRVFPTYVFDPRGVKSTTLNNATEYTLEFPMDNIAEWVVADNDPYCWALIAYDKGGREIARTGISYITLKLLRR